MMTQAEQIVHALRRGWHSYADLEALRVSTCPWRRLSESGARYLRKGEVIRRKTGADGLVRIKVERA